MKLDILGTVYIVIKDFKAENMPDDADGCIDPTTRIIKISEIERNKNSIQGIEAYQKKVLRHEIIHAYLYESGLWGDSGFAGIWAQNEEMVDWFAIQSPKIFKTFQEADCL